MKTKLKITMMMLLSTIVLIVIIFSTNNATYAAEDTLADIVIAQSQGTTWSSGASGVYNTTYSNGGSDYRYIGVEISNYVKFNDEMYQIIGVFDENTHGLSGKKLVKLIRARVFGDVSWGVVNTDTSSGIYSGYYNDWTGNQYTTPASVNILLNEYFLNNKIISNDYGNCSEWTYFSSSNDYKTKNCQLLGGAGIKEELRNYIETVTWHLNGYNSAKLTASNFYLCERGLYTGCTSANNGAASATTTAKIGLMYISDYAYASGYNASSSTALVRNYTAQQNWLYKNFEWTITPMYETDTDVFHITSNGSISNAVSYFGVSIRPTFYLKADVYVTGGDGTFDNPYTIACDTCS